MNLPTRRNILRHAAYMVLSESNVMMAHAQTVLWKYAKGDRGKLMLSDQEREFLLKSHQLTMALMQRNTRFNDHLRKTSHYGG